MKKFYRRYFLEIEGTIFWILPILIYLFIKFLKLDALLTYLVSHSSASFYSLIATISGTLLGLIIASVAILISAHESEKLSLLRKSKRYPDIYKLFFRTIEILGITTLVSIIASFLEISSPLFFIFLVGFISLTVYLIYRCVWILKKIVGILIK